MASVSVAVAVVLALSDAFGMGVLSLPLRLLYWLFLLGVGQVGSWLVRRSLDRMSFPLSRVVIAGVLGCVALSFPMTLVVWATTALALNEPLRLMRLPALYLPVLAVTGLMVGISLLAPRRPLTTHASRGQPFAGLGAPRILGRLPVGLRGAALWAVQAEDHYVRFHTSAGSDLVLLRFSDALSELDGIEGAQVHRSWWVARSAVVGTSRTNGKLSLRLTNDVEAPVSRSYFAALRAGGWFD
jgi:hypothetical protein